MTHRPLLLTAALACGMTLHAQDEINLLVGTFTDGTSEGIYSLRFNQQTGTARALDTLAIANPAYLCISADGRRIYAVSENNEPTDSVSTIAFDPATGRMTWMGARSNGAAGPCFVETNGRRLLTANYKGGSMHVFPIGDKGIVGPRMQQFGGSKADSDMLQQAAPHVHTARFAPDGRHVLASDFSANRILKFSLSASGQLKAKGVAARLDRNAGPRHIAFSPDGRFLYVMSELSGTVSVFRWRPNHIRPIQQIRSDSVNGHGGADIHFSPDGRFLYTSNRLKADGISIFSVDRKTGKLQKVGYQLTGIHPRNFNITPNGRFLLVACRDTEGIQVFRIDPSTGLLTDIRRNIAIDRPCCVRFFPENP